MKQHRRHLRIFLAVAVTAAHVSPVEGGGVGISTALHQEVAEPIEAQFSFYRPGVPGSRMRRDLEFQWSITYTQALGETTMTADEQLTLDQLGTTIVERHSNPFGIDAPDIQLVHDYFRVFDFPTIFPYWYNPLNPGQWSGFVFSDSIVSQQPVARSQRDHVDFYLFPLGLNDQSVGHYPSNFVSPLEDYSTGGCTSASCVHRENSIQVPGPGTGGFVDLTGTGWTRPGAGVNSGFCHEFQHGLRGIPGLEVGCTRHPATPKAPMRSPRCSQQAPKR